MPFKSKAQAGFMFANHPRIAKRFAAETPKVKELPYQKLQSKISPPKPMGTEIADLDENKKKMGF